MLSTQRIGLPQIESNLTSLRGFSSSRTVFSHLLRERSFQCASTHLCERKVCAAAAWGFFFVSFSAWQGSQFSLKPMTLPSSH